MPDSVSERMRLIQETTEELIKQEQQRRIEILWQWFTNTAELANSLATPSPPSEEEKNDV